MGLALAVVYDERSDAYHTYCEKDAGALVRALGAADLVVGFNVLGFDYVVLSAYTRRPLGRVPTFDLMQALRRRLGFRLGLGNLARSTFGTPKSADGLQSLAWVRQGRYDLVEAYCRHDVALTHRLFRCALETGRLCFERHGLRFRTPPLQWDLVAIARQAQREAAAWRPRAAHRLFSPGLPAAPLGFQA
jgi:DEAD/DEAH box helicase domain-containing protein